MKRILPLFIWCCILRLSAIAQIGVADPLTGNATINFYGQVVDQDGKPLVGAKVTISTFLAYQASPAKLATRHDRNALQTDTNGDFSLTGASGHSITVESIEKEGYKLSPKTARQYSYSWSANLFHPDPAAPVIFRMWKKQGAESLASSAWHGNVPCDGTLMTFDLLSGKRVKVGNLQMRCTLTPTNLKWGNKNLSDYTFQIAIIGGGIQRTSDDFTYFAPEKGYLPSVIIKEKAADPNHRAAELEQEFYIKTAEGHYGRLSINWAAWQKPPTHLEWDCSINPSGSRNLER